MKHLLKFNESHSLTVSRSWKITNDPNSNDIIISLKNDLATIAVKNLDDPKSNYIAVHTIRLNSDKRMRKFYDMVKEYFNEWRFKSVLPEIKKFIEYNLN